MILNHDRHTNIFFFTDMSKLEMDASGKVVTGQIAESTSFKTPADGAAADEDTPICDNVNVCSEETPPLSIKNEDTPQACSTNSATQPVESCDTSTDPIGSNPSSNSDDSNIQSEDVSGDLSQSNDTAALDSSGQA